MVSVATVVASCSFGVEWQDAQHSSEIIIRLQTAQRVCWLICTPCAPHCGSALCGVNCTPCVLPLWGCLRAPHCGSALCGVNCTPCVLPLRGCLRKKFIKIIMAQTLLLKFRGPSLKSQVSSLKSQVSSLKSHYSTTTTAFFAFCWMPFGRVMVYSSPFLEMVAFSEVPRMVALPVFTGFSVPVKV